MNSIGLLDIYNAAIDAVDPYEAVMKAMRIEGNRLHAAGGTYDLGVFRRILVVGAGKATARMAAAVETVIGDRVNEGLIIVKYGHTTPLRFIRQVEAGHPIPDQVGVEATKEIVDLLRKADEQALVLCLISGGGSALLVAPSDGITLREKQQATDLLMKAGATIHELNAVRKHLSSVKGGRLASTAYPATVVTLLLSDVINDSLDVIASGPTAPDRSTFADALSVIRKYGVKSSVPTGIVSYLEQGAIGGEEETVKEHAPCFSRTQNLIVGSLGQAIDAAEKKARSLGMTVEVVSRELQGEARVAARFLAGKAIQARNRLNSGEQCCLLSGGETTVTVNGNGKGGRNQELALAFSLEIAGVKGITLLSAGTDGTDGPTNAAGAIVDGAIVRRATESGLFPGDYLANNNSYEFFRRYDILTGEHAHIKTGPTGTNVMDIQIILVEG
jgi:glycerate 2-kinase